jgi:hypothetical protein
MAGAIRIVEVESKTQEEKDFISLPFTVYRDNPHYVPWFNRQMKKIISRRHPYFAHSDGEFFLALRENEPVGRIALLEPRRYNEYQNRREARFYFFEAKDDLDAVRAMFDHAEEWAKARNLDRIVGPQGFSSFAGSGILVDGFAHAASMTMMPYHLPYYRELIEAAGFEKYRDFYSAVLDAQSQGLPSKYQRVAEITLDRGRFTVLEIKTKGELKRLADEIGHIFNRSWDEHDDFTPLTEAELDQLKEDLLLVSEPSLVKVLRNEHEIAGFILAFPDLSRVMRKTGGKRSLLTLLSLHREKKRTDTFLINGLGILPQYRKTGGIAVLFSEISKALRAHGVRKAELTQVAETTDLMMSSIEKLEAKIYKTHRVYFKKLA